jgi:hypothetical protein
MKSIMLKFLFFSIAVYGGVYSVKPADNKGEITNKKTKNAQNQRKECEIKEKCRECTFEEIRTSSECQTTGYKQLKHCNFYDDVKLVDEVYVSEPCVENIKINSVYVLFVVCVILGGFSFYIRKSHKNFILQKTFEKLTIIRKDN